MIKTFRGLMADGAQDTIVLHTNDGSTGYKIVKFELFPSNPGTTVQESIVKVFSIDQTTSTATVDFSDNTLLAASYIALNSTTYYGSDIVTIFDNMVFNQDITLTHVELKATATVNYYLELEQVKLDLGENTVATLKDIRNVTAPKAV